MRLLTRKRIMDVVTNEQAGQNINKPGKIARLKQKLGHFGSVHAPPTAEDIRPYLEDSKRAGIAYLGVDGGDGTFHRAITEFIYVYGRDGPYPKIVLLRAGSMQTIANSLGTMKGSWETILEDIQLKIIEGLPFETVRLRVIEVNGKFGCIFGSGLAAHFLEEHYRAPQGERGPYRALEVTTKTIGSAFVNGKFMRKLAAPKKAFVSTPRHKIVGCFTAILASTIGEVGLGCAPTKRVRAYPDRFMLIASELSPWGFGRNVCKLWSGKTLPKTFEDFPYSAVIEYDEPTRYFVDGDLKEPTTLITLRIGPELEIIIR